MRLSLALLVIPLMVGCSSVNTTVPAKAAYDAKAAYGIALVAATAYARLPRCTDGGPKLCSDPAILAQMRKADLAADAATQAAENAVRALGSSPTAVQAALVAEQQAVAAFKTITDLYAPKGN